MRPLAFALALLPAAIASAGERALDLQLDLGTGVDTNPLRVVGGTASTDGFAALQARAKGRLTGEGWTLQGALTEASRIYATASGATALASRLDLAGSLALAGRLAATATFTASDLTERAHQLDQDALDAALGLSWSGRTGGAALTGGWSAYLPRAAVPQPAPLRAFQASGPAVSARGWWSPEGGNTLSAGYALWAPTYPRWDEIAPGGRADHTHTVFAEYAFRGPFAAALGYAFSWNRSSATGGDYERHRVTARAAAFLPLDFTLAARGTLQWSHYPDALFLSQQLLLAQGQENLDALEVRLTHPLAGPFELAVGFALYGGEFVQGAGGAPSFSRTLVTAGVSWRQGWSSTTGTP